MNSLAKAITLFLIIIFIYITFIFFNKNKKTIFENFDKSFYENINYQYDQYNYGDIEYTTPLKCDPYYELMIDPNLPSTKGCYISLNNLKKYYNPYLVNCPQIWNYNIEINGEKYCRQNGANIPVNYNE
jgi:hypothetical protein